jgi:hypothetical protein
MLRRRENEKRRRERGRTERVDRPFRRREESDRGLELRRSKGYG